MLEFWFSNVRILRLALVTRNRLTVRRSWWPKSAMTILTDPEPSDLPEETLIVRNLPEGFEIEGRMAFPMTIRNWRCGERKEFQLHLLFKKMELELPMVLGVWKLYLPSSFYHFVRTDYRFLVLSHRIQDQGTIPQHHSHVRPSTFVALGKGVLIPGSTKRIISAWERMSSK